MVPLATMANAEPGSPNYGNTNMATKKTTTATKTAADKKTSAKKPATAKTNAKKRLSQTDAALAVLKKSRKPLSCKEMVEAMANKSARCQPYHALNQVTPSAKNATFPGLWLDRDALRAGDRFRLSKTLQHGIQSI